MSIQLQHAKKLKFKDFTYVVYPVVACYESDGETWRCPKCFGTRGAIFRHGLNQYGFFQDIHVVFCECSECQERIAVLDFIDREIVIDEVSYVEINATGKMKRIEASEIESVGDLS